MDLFELLEKFFRGIVDFIYNVVETTVTVVRHPIAGPLRLTRRHRDPNARQLGGLTYLFLIFVWFYWLEVPWGREISRADLAETLTGTVATVPKFNIDATWPQILAAFISTVAIDSALRLLLRWRLPGRTRFRQTLLPTAEFTFLWMVAAIVILAFGWRPLFGQVTRITPPVVLAVVTISAYPAAAILIGLGTPLRRRILRRKVKLGLAMVGLTVLFYGSAAAGGYAARTVQDIRHEDEREMLVVETLRCEIQPDGRISADGIARFEIGKATAIEPNLLLLQPIQGTRVSTGILSNDERDGWPVEWREPPKKRFLIIEPGHAQLVEVVTLRPINMPKQPFDCRLAWSSYALLPDPDAGQFSWVRLKARQRSVAVRGWKLPEEAKSAAGSPS